MEPFMKSRSSLLNSQLYRHTNTFKIVLLLLLLNDAFGSETYKIKSVSANEGEDIALPTGETQIQRDGDIEWTFGDEGELIAEMNIRLNIFETYDGNNRRLGDRLELDRQTGSLIIRHARIKDSGVYTVQIINNGETKHKRFSLNISDALVPKTQKIKTVFATAGKSVDLLSGTEMFSEPLQRDDEVLWMFGKDRMLLAEIKPKLKIFETYPGDGGKFEDRLKLNHQTGSLIIRDARNTDSGDYTMQIINQGSASYTKFSVRVFGNTPPKRQRKVQGNLPKQDIAPASSFLLAGLMILGLVLWFCPCSA